MVEENFKIGIELELEQGSLANITKQVEQAVKAAFAAQTGKGGSARPGRTGPKPPVGGGAGTARSMADATRASSKDFVQAIKSAASSNDQSSKSFEQAALAVVRSVNRLTASLEKQGAGGGAPRKAGVQENLRNKQQGRSNVATADTIDTRRRTGGGVPATGGVSTTQTDPPGKARPKTGVQKKDIKQKAADKPAHPQEKFAQQTALQLKKSLAELEASIQGLGSLKAIPNLFRKAGLPRAADVRVGQGAAVEVKTPSGQAKIVTTTIRIFGKEVQEVTNIISKRINELRGAPGYQKRMQTIERTAGRDPGKAVSMLRSDFKGIHESLAVVKQGGAAAYAKGREATVDIDFGDNPELIARLSALKDESSQIALVNKEIFNMTGLMSKLRKEFGIEAMGSYGIGEERAAEAKIIKDQPGPQGRPIGAQMPVQLADLSGMILGGKGGMRWARSAQPQQARQMVQGERPQIVGKGEAQAYETGLWKKEMTRTMKTSFLDPAKVPEVHEDMILIDAEAAKKMSMMEPGVTQAMKTAAPGLKPGQALEQGQVMGYDIEGKEITFDMKGISAEVEAVEEVMENGIEGVRVKFKEMYQMVTGSKMSEISGFKGVVKVEKDMARKRGLPAGTEVGVSAVGMAKRNVLSAPMKMMASEIAKAVNAANDGFKVSGQEVADKIAKAMDPKGGFQDLTQSVESVATGYGLKGFTGTQTGPGGMKALTGDMPWYRQKEPRAPGAAEIGTKFFDLPAMGSLKGRAGTAKMAEDMTAQMDKVAKSQTEYLATLQALTGATEIAAEGLEQMNPEDFKRLPSEVGPKAAFEGTILDKLKASEAKAIRMPAAGGGERLLRLPAMGRKLGERGAFETTLGAMGPEDVTRRYDKILETGQNIRVAEGRIAPDVTEGGDIAKEMFFKTRDHIGALVKELHQLDLKSQEGAAAADDFVNSLLPVIEALDTTLTETVGFRPISKAGKVGETVIPTGQKGTTKGVAGARAGEFIKGAPTAQQRLLRTQDVLSGRAATKGSGFENVRTAGEMLNNFKLLQGVMDTLGVSALQDADAIGKLYTRLEQLEEGLLGMYASMGLGPASSKKASDPERIPFAAQIGAGATVAHKELTAVQFRTDVDDELLQVQNRLEQLADSGQNVGEALAAVEQLSQLQGDVTKIPRDVVLLNQQDYDNLVEATMKHRKIDKGEAEKRLGRPGLLQRYPTTGGASFLATRMKVDPSGEVPAGKIGVAGPMAADPKALATMLKPLKELEAGLYGTIEANQGQGEAAEAARAELSNLVPVLQKLNQLYLAAGLNLDFDGDKITWLADTATKAGSGLQTFTQKVESGGISFQQIAAEGAGKIGAGGAESVQGYSELFARKAKGRTGEYKRAVLAPETGETAQFESMAHIAGKKSVGLLSDAFNKIQVAVLTGTREAGDAFSTGMDYIMLNINKSLAQKGGEGGVAGPLEFIEDLKSGQLGKMFKGMKAGGAGIYGEMGAENERRRGRTQEELSRKFMMGGEAGLRGVAAEEGIEGMMPKGDITYENFRSVIDKMVNELDLEALITRMFEQMKANMIKALQSEGMEMPEIQKEMATMFKPGKGGKIPGMPIDRLLAGVRPEYAATRRAPVKEIQKGTPMEQAQHVLKLFGKNLAEEVKEMSDDFSIDDYVDITAEGKELGDKILTMFDLLRQSLGFEVVGKQQGFQKLTKATYTQKQLSGVKGLHVPEKGPGGEKLPGKVFLSGEKIVGPLIKGLTDLASASPMTAKELGNLVISLRTFGATLAHENVHKINKNIGKPLRDLVRSLQSTATPLGQAAASIIEKMKGLANIKKLHGAVTTARAGAAARGVSIKKDPGVQKAQAALMQQVGEELLASQTDPKFLGKLQKAGVSPEATEELAGQFGKLMEDPGAAGVQESMEFGRQASSAIVQAYVQGMKEEGPEGVSGSSIKTDAQKVMDALGEQALGGFQDAMDRMYKQQKVVQAGTQQLGLPGIVPGVGGKLEFAEPIAEPAYGERFKGPAGRIKEKLAAARGGKLDLAAGPLETSQKEMRTAAKELEASIGAIEGEGGPARGTGRKAYIKAMREFNQAVSVSFLNKQRDLRAELSRLREDTTGKPGEIANVLAQIDEAVLEHENFIVGTMKRFGGGKGFAAESPFLTQQGELTPEMMEAGLKPGPDMLQARVATIAGQDPKERKRFFDQMGVSLDEAGESIEHNRDLTKAWASIFEAAEKSPKTIHVTLKKMAEILSATAGHVGQIKGKFSESAQAAVQLAQKAKEAAAVYEGKPTGTRAQMMLAEETGGAAGRKAIAAGRGGGRIGPSVEAQYKAAREAMKQYQKQLQEVIKTQGYQKMGAPKAFEPMTRDIVDPKTEKTIQRIRITAKRAGKDIKVAMEQAGSAAAGFGMQMRGALRRVVQWGFASGIVYGTIRAFRNLVSTITEVQDKIMQLQKVMDTTITDFGAMQDAAVGMAKEFGISISDVLDGMVVYGQQGLKMNKIMERTNATMLAVNVTTLSATEATEALTAAHKVFGDTVSSSSEFVDTWGAVAAKHAITAKDLADAVKRSGAAADVAGLGFEDFMGIITSIGAVTRQTGKEIATSTKFMFRAMRRPTAQKELAGIGITSLEKGTGDLRPAMDILKDVANSWDELSRAQQINISQAMAGIRHYNSFIVLMNNFDEALVASVDAQNSQGFAVRKNALAMKTFSKQMQVLKETVKSLSLTLGKAILPAATGVVKVFGGVVDVLNLLPTALLTGVAGFAALGVAGVKAADIVVDSLDAILGYGGMAPTGAKDKGIFKTIRGAFKDVGRGIGRGARTGARAAAPAAAMVAGEFTEAGMVGASDAGTESLGRLGLAAQKVGAKFTGMGRSSIAALRRIEKSAVSTGAAIAASTVILAGVIAVIVGLVYVYKQMSRTGHDVAKEMENVIGQSKDMANALRGMSTGLERVSLAYKKVGSAMDKIEDTEKLRDALNARNFKSAAVAAQKYADVVADVSKAIATIDPKNIEGITETGDYIVKVDEAMKGLTISAIDARNAITAALQTKVLKAFAKDLTEASGVWNKLKQIFTGGKEGGIEEFSGLGKLKKNQEALKKLLDTRAAIASMGHIDVTTGAKLVELTQERAELEGDILKTSMEIKKIMDAMPTFESVGMAQKMMTPDFAKAIEAALPSEVFGRGATTESVMFSVLAKSAGIGGMVDRRAAATPALLGGTLMERGIMPQVSGGLTPQQTGDIALLGPEVATNLIKSMGLALSPDKLKETAKGAQILIAEVDEITGKAMWLFVDRFGNTTGRATGAAVEAAVAAAEEKLKDQPEKLKMLYQKYTRKGMEDAAEATERILSLIFVGALAGIRQPKGGMPDIGVGTAQELSGPQRSMKVIGIELSRLMEIQNEMTQITKEYSETVLSDVAGAYAGQAKSGSALKALTADMVTLVKQLQEEAFNLSVISHYQKAIGELGLSMDTAAIAAEDAAMSEQTRAKFLIQTSGALAGMSEIPNINFGKTLKELTGAERLSIEIPGFKSMLGDLASATRKRDADVEQVVEIRKQKAYFKRMVASMEAQGQTLEGAQTAKDLELLGQGVTKNTIESIKAQQQGDQLTQAILKEQMSVEEKMLTTLEMMLDIAAAEDPKELKERKKEILQKLKEGEAGKSGRILSAAYQKQHGTQKTIEMTMKQFGITDIDLETGKEGGRFRKTEGIGTGMEGLTGDAKSLAEDMRDDYVQILNAMKVISEQQIPIGTVFKTGEDAGKRKGHFGLESLQKEEMKLQERWFAQGKTLENLNAFVMADLSDPINKEQADAEKKKTHAEKMAASRKKAQDIIVKAYNAFHNAEMKVIAGINEGTDVMLAMEPARLAIVARDFGKTLDDLILGFKKAEALEYTKIKSDLEGPFARVGQPGFKTSFEKRREEIEEKRGPGRGRTREEARQAAEELAKVDFDEKEARIKQTQDIETKALRTQQSQAEQLRSTLADAFFAGDFAGMPDLQGEVKRVMNILTDELATSEQARMVGDKLKYRGVGSLEEAKRLAVRAKEVAKEKAAEAMTKVNKESITDPIKEAIAKGTSATHETNQILRSMGGVPPAGLAAVASGQIPFGQQPGGAGPAPLAAQVVPTALPAAAAAAGVAPIPGVTPDERAQLEALGMPVPGVPRAPTPIPEISAEQRAQLEALGMPVPGARAATPVAPTAEITRADPAQLTGEGRTKFGGLEFGKDRKPFEGVRFKPMEVEGQAGYTAADKYKRLPTAAEEGQTGMFVKEQIIRREKKGLTGEEEMASLARLEKANPATQFFAPGGEDSTLQTSYQSAVGRSNKIRAANAAARGASGTGDAEAAVISAKGELTAEAPSTQLAAQAGRPVPTADATKGDEEVKGAVNLLTDAVTKIMSTLEGLTGIGNKVDGVRSSVDSLKTEGLKAEVTGTVAISNASDIGDAAGTAAATSAGADVADARLRLQVLEGLVDPNGLPIEAQIEGLQTNIDASVQTHRDELETARTEIVDEAKAAATAATADEIAALNEELAALKIIEEELKTSQEDQDLILTNLDQQILETEQKLAEAVTKAEDAAEIAEQAGDKLTDVDERLTTAEEDSEAAKTAATVAETAATTANEISGTTKIKLDTLEAGINIRKASVDGRLSTLDGAVVRIDAKDEKQDDTLGKHDSRIHQADQKARDAMNEARKK